MPLTFDLPFEELLTYQGCTPRPADFDEYWARAEAELDDIPPDVEIVAADFQVPYARCAHLYFTGTGRARLHALLLTPPDPAAPHPAVLQFHGYNGRAGDWSQRLGYAALGYTVAVLDCRGQGGRSVSETSGMGWPTGNYLLHGIDDPDNLLYRHVFLDTLRLARIVMSMDEVDPDRVGVTGLSQGGGLSIACAALEPRIRIAAPVYPFLCDYRRAWHLNLDRPPYKEITDYFRRRDPLHERADEVFGRLGYVDVQHLAPRVRARVELTVGLHDEVCPPSTQFAVYNKLRGEKSCRVYPDFGHEPLPRTDDAIFALLRDL